MLSTSRGMLFVCLMVFNSTFNDISVILWRSVLLVEETGGPRENHQHVARTACKISNLPFLVTWSSCVHKLIRIISITIFSWTYLIGWFSTLDNYSVHICIDLNWFLIWMTDSNRNQKPVRVSHSNQKPVRISHSNQKPVRISHSNQKHLLISHTNQKPVRISHSNQKPKTCFWFEWLIKTCYLIWMTDSNRFLICVTD
jgi:hypothetical protein